MRGLGFGEPGPAWPLFKAIAQHCQSPGPDLESAPMEKALEDLAQDRYQERVKGWLETMFTRPVEIVTVLREQARMELTEAELRAAAEDLAEWLYLKRIADQFYFADFKSRQDGQLVSVPLDDIFLPLQVVPETHEISRQEWERQLTAELERADESQQLALCSELRDPRWHRPLKQLDDARAPGEMFWRSGPVVLLGGPGSGKTTLVKHLARSCALGEARLDERVPDLPWCFPILLPITPYMDGGGDVTLLEYSERLLREDGGEALLARARRHFRHGHVLLLVDGLDAVADPGQRLAAAKALDHLARNLEGNRLLVTSRRAGYALGRLSFPAAHHFLCPVAPSDFTTFAERWYVALAKARTGGGADLAAARQQAKELNDEIGPNPGTAALATNPLLLTILALSKHPEVELPQDRLDFYWSALERSRESWPLDCLAEQVGLRHHQADAVLLAVARTLRAERSEETRQSLVETLKSVRTPLAPPVQAEFLTLTSDPAWTVRMEAVRLVSLSPRLEAAAVDCLQGLLERDEDADVQAHAAWGLWRQGRRTEAVVKALARGLWSRDSGLTHPPDEDFELALVRLLEEPAGHARWWAKIHLCQWEPPATAVRALLPLLEGSAPVSLDAAEVLCRWGHQEQALPTLLKRLQSPKAGVRCSAATVLAECGLLEQAQPVLLKLLEEREPFVRLRAAAALGQGGHRETALPVLVKLLEDPDADVRSSAAETLREWGSQPTALPMLVQLLENGGGAARYLAAQTLDLWGHRDVVLAGLLKVLEGPEAAGRLQAAALLGSRGRRHQALPALLRLLEDPKLGRRLEAAQLLGEWEQPALGMPAMVELLATPDTALRLKTIELLARWRPQPSGLSAMVKLLGDPDREVRSRALAVLAHWGPQPAGVPELAALLDDPDPTRRLTVAQTLCHWGEFTIGLPALVKLLAGPRSRELFEAEFWLERWGPREPALASLLKLLETPESEVRSRSMAMLRRLAEEETVRGTSEVTKRLLQELTGEPEPAALAALESRRRRAQAQDQARLDDLLTARPSDTLPKRALREILSRLIGLH